jgi:hypothetical protein
MGKIGKTFALFLTLIIAMSCLTTLAKPVSAQTIPKPSVPEFNVTLIDSSYDIPPSSTVNPYNGQVITEAGRHIESRTIQLSIKNQPFTPFLIKEQYGDRTVYLHHEIRWKGHFEKDWHQNYYPLDEYFALSLEDARLKTEYSLFSYKGEYSSAGWSGLGPTLPPDAQVDFQVKALIGYVSRYAVPGTSGWAFNGEESDWSNTQAITIGETSASTSPSPIPSSTQNTIPTPTPTVPEFPFIIVIAIIIAVLTLTVSVFKRKIR